MYKIEHKRIKTQMPLFEMKHHIYKNANGINNQLFEEAKNILSSFMLLCYLKVDIEQKLSKIHHINPKRFSLELSEDCVAPESGLATRRIFYKNTEIKRQTLK